MKAYLLAALSIGFLAALLICIIWFPLAVGQQVCEYSEYRQPVAVFEFTASCLGAAFIPAVIRKLLKKR